MRMKRAAATLLCLLLLLALGGCSFSFRQAIQPDTLPPESVTPAPEDTPIPVPSDTPAGPAQTVDATPSAAPATDAPSPLPSLSLSPQHTPPKVTSTPLPSESIIPSFSPAPSHTPQPSDEPPEAPIYFDAGMYKVGDDIKAGTYMAFAAKQHWISSISVRDSSRADAKVLLYDVFERHSIIEVFEGQYLEISGATFTAIENTEDLLDPDDELIEPGLYKVGFHLPAGEYRTVVDPKSLLPMIVLYKDATQSAIIHLSTPQGSGYITVEDGQYLKLSGVSLKR